MSAIEKKKIYCRSCRNATTHSVLNKVDVYDNDEEAGIWVSNEYITLQCNGCEAVCLMEESTCSEDYDPETNKLESTIAIHPDPFTNRPEVSETYHLPKVIRKIYSETITAFNRKLSILTSIGIRATIEAICVDNKVEGKDLQKRIDKLLEMGFMTSKEAELLHLTRFMGNAAAHELQEPVIDELTAGLDIIESALRNAYILPEKAANLSRYKKKTSGDKAI